MRLSRFTTTYRDAAAGEHVLYDVIADKYVGVDDAMLRAIEGWGEGRPVAGEHREAAGALREMGFLVAGPADDEARLAAHWARAEEGMPGALYATVLPTISCNLACTYCFQREHPASGDMSPETEAATLRFLLSRVDALRLRRLVVHYFGGEPLVRKDLVLRTARTLAAEMARRGGSFGWEMTTNGVGLEPRLVNELLALGDGSIKVTLDGDRETHDAQRVRRGGQGTFDQVFRAVVAVARECPGLRLRVASNLGPGQEASAERLLERMQRAGLAGLVSTVKFQGILKLAGDEDGCSGCSRGPSSEALVQLGRSARDRGLSPARADSIDEAGLCELHWKTGYVVDSEGRLYHCVEVAGRPEMAVGDVWKGESRPDPLLRQKPWERHEPCRTCAYLPVCGGGCLGSRYLATGRTGEVDCRRDDFENRFREQVVSRYLAEFHGGEQQEAA